ncbi:RNA-binding protein 39 [Cocos nucifera]|uniref:RNA-binding protein 39 n=1 Tax=Cocos nucifera TaxID=13894 RepID=A0A8K0IE22_COCNU|nr:RNA-binding protein 39 [Cocos nucifera]
MDFDEYEYLEKTVENPEARKEKEAANGHGDIPNEKGREKSSRHRVSDDGERDSDDRRSKRSRSEDGSARDRDRHRDRERGSSRHRSSLDRDDRERHRSGREHRDRDRDRDGDREERKGKDRDRDRERERERAREREREKESERERSRRSRSRSERLREEERERYRERSRDREYVEKEREREREYRERDRDARCARAIFRWSLQLSLAQELRNAGEGSLELFHRSISSSDAYDQMGVQRYKEKKEEAAEPEADPERDQRTVFAYQICLKADERDVYEFFSRAGKVRDVRLIMDRNSRRSKGVGYIEFYDAMSVPMAIALSGQPLLGQPVMVKPSEAEKNLVQSTTSAAGAAGLTGPFSAAARKLYVGNLHFNMTEDQLRQVFEPFGQVELVQLPLDETGHCKGFGFVQFARLEDAKAAQSLNGQLEIAGRTIKVSTVTDQAGMRDAGANAGDLDDDEGGGLSLNAHSRALLMQKLDRTGTATSVAGALVAPAVNTAAPTLPTASVLGVPQMVAPLLQPTVPALAGLPTSSLAVASTTTQPVETVGIPSECLLLKNMFDPNVETELDFDLDIKEDVQDECSKFGTVKHIFVDKNSAGHVYLRFDNITSAMNAQRALHGRWFAGKMITATFMLPQQYEAKFPSKG